jgi:photosystem II stability/assembly factor-like uncharacterized protein
MISGTRFFNDSTGWLKYLDLGTGTTHAARTVDGGFTLIDAFPYSVVEPYSYRFVGVDAVLAYKNTNDAGPAEVRASADQGRTWTPSFAAAWNDTIRFLVQPDRLIRNDRDCYLVCSQGLLHTRDGGATWVMLRALAALERLAAAPMIDMASPDHGWYVSQRRIYRSDDEGLTWTPAFQLPDSAAGEEFFCLDAVDGSHVFAQTLPRNTLYVTTDAGGTWESYLPVKGVSSTRSFANGVSFGIAGSGSFEIYKTVDYWRSSAQRVFSWSAGQGSSTNAALYVLDASTAWVTGYNVVWRTTDGGISWCETRPAAPTAPLIRSIHPNPAGATATISYVTADADPASVTLDLRDLLGRCIRSMILEPSESAAYSSTIDCSTLRTGVYFVTIRAGRRFDTRKLVVAR